MDPRSRRPDRTRAVGSSPRVHADRLARRWEALLWALPLVAAAASARAAASFYVLHPYLLGDAWLRNADAEYTALCLAPFALAGLLRARAQPRSAVLWIAAGLALVVLAHNLSGLWLAAVC